VIETGPDGARRSRGQRRGAVDTEVARLMQSIVGADEASLKATFDAASEGSLERWTVSLTPRAREMARFLKVVRLGGSRHLESIEIEETSGNSTLIRLRQHAVAEKVAADELALFKRAVTLRARSWLFLAVLGVAAAILAGMLSRGVPLQTNVLAMLPATERDPVAEKVVASLGAAIGSRVLVLFSHGDEARAEKLQRAVCRHGDGRRRAAADGATAGARSAGPARALRANRFGLLADADREALASGRWRARDSVLQQIVSPVGGMAALPLAQDPFGFFGRWMASIVPSAGTNAFRGRLPPLPRRRADPRWWCSAKSTATSTTTQVQVRAVAAWERGAKEALAVAPGSEILRTGTVFFAASARAAAMADMDRIAIGSIVGIALLMLVAFRSLRPIALGLLSAGAGILVATLTAARHRRRAAPRHPRLRREPDRRSDRLRDPVLRRAPRRRQPLDARVGRRAGAPGAHRRRSDKPARLRVARLLPFPGGLANRALRLRRPDRRRPSVQWLLPGLMTRTLATRSRGPRHSGRRGMLERWRGLLSGRRAMIVAALALVVSVPGLLALQANDDVRLLVPRQPELATQDAAIRSQTGFDAGSRFFLVRGANEEDVLLNETHLTKRLRELEGAGALIGHQAVSDFVPPRAAQEANRALLQKHVFADREALTRTLLDVGFRADAVKALPGEFDRAARPLAVADWLASPLSTPFRHLWAPAGETVPASVVIMVGERDPARVAQASAGLDGVTLIDKAASVSQLLGWYRAWAAPGLAAAALMMLIVLVIRYGARPALLVLVPVLLAETVSLAVFGFAGVPVTLFGVVGWTLGLGIGVNYAIFLREGIDRPGATRWQ
jgi:predicted exporter